MNKIFDCKKIPDHVKKKFTTYVATTMFSTMLSSIYVSVDGIFIGQAVGDAGLTAVNIIWPIEALATAVARGFGLGGAICFAIALGEKSEEKAGKYRGNTILLLLLDYLIMAVFVGHFYPEILRLFGATDAQVYRLAADYTKIYVIGCIFQILNCGVQPFLRNADKPVMVMVFQIIGAVINVILDYFFVIIFGWEVWGAGLATIIAEAVASVLTLLVFFCEKRYPHHRKEYIPDFAFIKQILCSSISPVGATLCNSIVIIFNNRFCLYYGGVIATAAYSVVNYSYCVGYMFVMGVGEGIQPLISYNYGKKDYKEMKEYIRLGKLTIGIIGVLVTGIFILARKPIAILFGASDKAVQIVMEAICMSATVFLFKGFVRLKSACFNAMDKNKYSNILVYAESLVLTPALLVIFAHFMGLNGVWITMPAVQIILVCMGILFEKKIKKC